MGEGWSSGLFGFWLRFGSVTGVFSNLRLRRGLAKNQKSSLRAGYSFSSNALNSSIGAPQQHRADQLEDKIRYPQDDMGSQLRMRGQRLPHHQERVIHRHQDQGHK